MKRLGNKLIFCFNLSHHRQRRITHPGGAFPRMNAVADQPETRYRGAVSEAKGAKGGNALTNPTHGAAIATRESGKSTRRSRFLVKDMRWTQIKELAKANDRLFSIPLLHS